jgi:hypothetical protein
MAAAYRTYRKRFGSLKDWHFHPDCPDWPEGDYLEQKQAPPSGDYCQQCLDLQKRRNREPKPQAER